MLLTASRTPSPCVSGLVWSWILNVKIGLNGLKAPKGKEGAFKGHFTIILNKRGSRREAIASPFRGFVFRKSG